MCYGKVNGSRVTKMDARFLLSPPSVRVSDDVRSHTYKTAAAVGALATVAFLVTTPRWRPPAPAMSPPTCSRGGT